MVTPLKTRVHLLIPVDWLSLFGVFISFGGPYPFVVSLPGGRGFHEKADPCQA